MGIYKIDFEGSWLGGVAIVAAGSKREAWEILRAENPPNLGEYNEKAINLVDDSPVIYLDDGDY